MPLTKVTKRKHQRQCSYENVNIILDLFIKQRGGSTNRKNTYKRSEHQEENEVARLLNCEYEEALRQVYNESLLQDNLYEEILWELSNGLAGLAYISTNKMEIN